MDYSWLLKMVNAVEEQYPVANWHINGVHIWPIVRINFVWNNMNALSEITSIKTCKWTKMLEYIAKGLGGACIDRSHIDLKKYADIIFLGSNAERTIMLPSGEKVGTVLDAIKSIFLTKGVTFFSLEDILETKLNIPRYSLSDFSVSRRALEGMILTKFTRPDNCRINLPQMDLVKSFLSEEAGVKEFLSINDLCKGANYIRFMADYFTFIIKQKQAKLGINFCWYNKNSMAFAYACRKLNIPCIDIQHGAAGSHNHVGYVRWNAMPNGGFNTMPTHFWTWDQRDLEAIYAWRNNREGHNVKAFVGGIPSSIVYNTCAKSVIKYWEAKLKKDVLPRDKVICLISLQTAYKLPAWVNDAIRGSQDRIFWLIRRHPVNDSTQDEFIREIEGFANVEYEMASSCPLPVVLKYVDCHVTHHSTVVIDAFRQGIKSVIVAKCGCDAYKEELAGGICIYATSCDELLNGIMIQKSNHGDLNKDTMLPGIKYIEDLLERQLS